MEDMVTKLRTAAQLINEVAEELGKSEEKLVTFTDVRTILADIAGKGFADEVKALIKKHNASKLSDIPETEYADVVKEAEAIGNAS